MFWQESKTVGNFAVSDDVTDIAYQISCRTLPVDHAWELSQAVMKVLPWIGEETGAGVHTIHVADSGNGWMRPENAGDLLYLSRRTKLVLRVPRQRIENAKNLVGHTLDVAGNPLTVGAATLKPFTAITTLFARYVVSDAGQDENAFLGEVVRELNTMGIQPKKMLCGIEHSLAAPGKPVRTRSLMIAELGQPESVTLQQRGIGPMRQAGCGLFLPHKDIRELKQALE